jgi:hypothetical protein
VQSVLVSMPEQVFIWDGSFSFSSELFTEGVFHVL